MLLKLISVIFFCAIALFLWSKCDYYEDVSSNDSFEKGDISQTLSRRKRFLVFPEGSSFQLVFCTQAAAIIQIGDILQFSSTAALAWNLPTDPNFLRMLKYDKTAQRRGDDRHIYYVDEAGKFLARVPYKRPTIVNPAFAKRSVDEKIAAKERIDRTKMHEGQSKRDFLKNQHLDAVEFHRSNRVDLYEKLVPLIDALGGDGRRCVLYQLCESAKISRQGTFLQELLGAVFTLPKGKEFIEEQHRAFDKAQNQNEDCSALYAGCQNRLR